MRVSLPFGLTFPLLVGLLMFSAATEAYAQGGSASSPVQRAQDHASSALTYLSTWDGRDCLSEPINNARYALARLSGLLSATGASATNPGLSSVERTIYLRRYGQMADMQISTQLEIADAYLQHNCIDDADKLYRDIVSDFPGSRYEAARQRAQIGIDDVRERRRSSEAPS